MEMTEENILEQAKQHKAYVEDYETQWRHDFTYCMNFVNGKQWNRTERTKRLANGRTVAVRNETKNYINHILNEVEECNIGINVKSVGMHSDPKATEILEGIIRNIEERSNAQEAYYNALYHQVVGGAGYIRVIMHQQRKIYISMVKNPLHVYLDPDAILPSGKDASFCLIKNIHSIKNAKHIYGNQIKDHIDDYKKLTDRLTVWEYFYLDEADNKTIHYVKILGDDFKNILSQEKWAGDYIPVIRVLGYQNYNEEGARYGHVKNLIEPQKTLNRAISNQADYLEQTIDTPWIISSDAMSVDVKDEWENINTRKPKVLVYQAGASEPKRILPSGSSNAFDNAVQQASLELKAVSGQFHASLGQASNETSGIAIIKRKQFADKSIAHFQLQLMKGIEFVGEIIINLIARNYKKRDVLQIIGNDGKEQHIEINPSQKQSVQELENLGETQEKKIIIGKEEKTIHKVFNPQYGRYQVKAEAGSISSTRGTIKLFGRIIAVRPINITSKQKIFNQIIGTTF